MKSLSLGLFVIFVFFGITACSADDGDDCSTIVWNKCASCHSISHTCKKEGKSSAYWKRRVDDMIKFNADISDKERVIIADCLADVAVFNKICKPGE